MPGQEKWRHRLQFALPAQRVAAYLQVLREVVLARKAGTTNNDEALAILLIGSAYPEISLASPESADADCANEILELALFKLDAPEATEGEGETIDQIWDQIEALLAKNDSDPAIRAI